jgi:HK97 family phage portal protein
MLATLRRWFGVERRAVSYADPVLQRLYGDGAHTASGESVTVERAVGLSAVWACTSLISGSIAAMPCLLYRKLPNGERERAVEHPLYDVLRTRPNPAQSVVAFWESMVTALLLRGNAYAVISRDDSNAVRGLWFVSPDRVTVEPLKNGKLRYRVAAGASTQTVSADDMLHVCGPLSDDGYTGRSVIATFRETLGFGLALERYGSEFFSNGATPSGVLETKSRLSDTAYKNLESSWTSAHAQKGRRHRTVVLEEGVEFKPIGVSHEDSQFLEARAFSVQEIARIFNVPAHMINADVKTSLTYANAETRSLDFLKFCLGPWLSRIESAVNFACISPLERHRFYAEFLPDSLLSTTTKDRYDAYAVGLSNGFLTVDEVRRKENLPALEPPKVG